MEVALKCDFVGCDVIGLQETIEAAGFHPCLAVGNVQTVRAKGGSGGQDGVGLAVKSSIITQEQWAREPINEPLVSLAIQLLGKLDAVTFVVGNRQTTRNSLLRKGGRVSWANLSDLVEQVSNKDYKLFVLLIPDRGKRDVG